MHLSDKTLEKLRNLINEETEYRSGPNLVSFFNSLGFKDKYENFPSRWVYTDDILKIINGKVELDNCIKKLFSPINFIGRFSELDKFIEDFNQYLAFDDWKVVRREKEITFSRADKIDFSKNNKKENTSEEDFIEQNFENANINKLNLDSVVTSILDQRIKEAEIAIKNDLPLSGIFIIGSILEGVFFGVASSKMKEFNQANSSPKKDGKVKNFADWTLNDYINVCYELKLIGENVKKFSHEVRDFRNYIHPYHQMACNFSPTIRSSKLCWQVLLAVIEDLSK
jgi:hypothetical protein